ncbi:hypothetical protein [Niveispirillum sp.]|uniref:hypothetical protein n=1 Tax=Niveispirillum sp. TaxID=1917217 RepID=UPI001B479123|nr:hypothetical protein [Niveispirillum sp.]MBP7338708.1 hypothetical protein [Niveispirillum sp.]
MADPRRSSALAELAAALLEAADPVAAGRLAFAALIRPALFDPDHGARGHLENLLGHPGLEAEAPLIEGLAGLGYEVRLSARLLAELAGTRPPPAEPAARQRLANWLAEARHRKTMHQPTYFIFHRELRPENEIGGVAEAVLDGAANAEALAGDLINRLAHNRSAQETLVSEAERRSSRPRRDRIEGMALDWFCRGIQEACDHLSDWLEACRQDARQTQDHSRERLRRVLGPVRKALEATVGGSTEGEGMLAEAAGLILTAKLDDLRVLIDGRAAVSVAPRLHDLLEAPLLRLFEGREALPGRLRLLTMNCDVPRRADGFLPPAFGSAAGGRYQLLAARADVSIDQILRQIGSEAPDAPWIVVLFSRLSVKDRHRLARQMRSEARSAIVLDETLLLFAGLESDDPLSIFFDCAMPFAWVQPYTISPGQIPSEIFFGREVEIDRIVSRNAEGCLIYGGRQLGKSVLLNHIRGERHRPERGELALYLDIRSIGGPGVPTEGIWQSLAHDLRRFKDFKEIAPDPKNLIAAIEIWLDRDPTRRLLVMFDEADNFLRAEHAAGYPHLLPIKGLMEKTGRRFKAVFAGLHNVRRMARAPNSPLPHLGEPICIGPMNQTPANRAALRRLAVEPMRAAGLDYSNPGLASDMLARMNYYPSLVQVFGRQIVESFGRRPYAGEEGPCWKLDRENMFEGAAAERIASQIRDRFQLTLNLDVRFDCIARSIALHRLDATGGDNQVFAQGLTAAEIRQVTYWPKALAQPTMTDFEELLEELVDLGILNRFPDNRYGLRNAQVAQMLGRQEELEEALLRLDEREDDPAYDAALFFRLLGHKMPTTRAPLSDRDLDRLFDRRVFGIRLVRSTTAVAGDDVAGLILAAAQLWLPECDHIRTKGEDAQVRRALDRVKTAPAVLVIEGDWSSSSAAQLARQPKVARGEVLPIWCGSLGDLPVEGMIVFDVGAWSEAMLRHWLADEGLAPALDDPQTRTALMAATGGAPIRLEMLRGDLQNLAARPVADRVEFLVAWAEKTPLHAEALGLDQADLACLKTIRELEDESPSRDELAAFCPDATETRLERLAVLGTLRQGRTPGAAPILTPLGQLIAA